MNDEPCRTLLLAFVIPTILCKDDPDDMADAIGDVAALVGWDISAIPAPQWLTAESLRLMRERLA